MYIYIDRYLLSNRRRVNSTEFCVLYFPRFCEDPFDCFVKEIKQKPLAVYFTL